MARIQRASPYNNFMTVGLKAYRQLRPEIDRKTTFKQVASYWKKFKYATEAQLLQGTLTQETEAKLLPILVKLFSSNDDSDQAQITPIQPDLACDNFITLATIAYKQTFDDYDANTSSILKQYWHYLDLAPETMTLLSKPLTDETKNQLLPYIASLIISPTKPDIRDNFMEMGMLAHSKMFPDTNQAYSLNLIETMFNDRTRLFTPEQLKRFEGELSNDTMIELQPIMARVILNYRREDTPEPELDFEPDFEPDFAQVIANIDTVNHFRTYMRIGLKLYAELFPREPSTHFTTVAGYYSTWLDHHAMVDLLDRDVTQPYMLNMFLEPMQNSL